MKHSKKWKFSEQKENCSSWVSCDVDHERLYEEDGTMDGFLGLEELKDYDDEELRKIVGPPPKKTKKINIKKGIVSGGLDHEEVSLTSTSVDIEESKGHDVEKGLCEKESNCVENPDKKLSKKERRKEKRKQSYKLLLKERRKKMKELKRQRVLESTKNITDMNLGTQNDENAFPNANSNVVKKDMSEWHGLGVPDVILKALYECEFYSPTPIQKQALPHGIFYYQDILGAAETGNFDLYYFIVFGP